MTDRELFEKALEALEPDWELAEWYVEELQNKAITALRERLAQPEQESKCVAIIEVFGKDWRLDYMSLPVGKHKLYTQQYTYTAPSDATQPMASTEQEPIAWMVYTQDGKSVCVTDNPTDFTEQHRALPLYTAPPRREWVGLTDEVIWLEYQRFWPFHPAEEPILAKDIVKFARAIEAKLKEKNT